MMPLAAVGGALNMFYSVLSLAVKVTGEKRTPLAARTIEILLGENMSQYHRPAELFRRIRANESGQMPCSYPKYEPQNISHGYFL